MLVLGIETSCDETAVTILDSRKRVYINKIFSQTKFHRNFGGVVPKIATKNQHINFKNLIRMIIRHLKLLKKIMKIHKI